MQRTVQEIADFVQGTVTSLAETRVARVASIASATPDDLVFAEDEKTLQQALASSAGAVVTGAFAGGHTYLKAVVTATQPRLAFARAAGFLCPAAKRNAGVHASAVVESTARLAKDVSVEARSVIGENVEIGEGSWIGAGCVIGADVSLGAGCEVFPNVTIYSGTRLGNRVVVHAGTVLGSDGFGYVRDRDTGHYEKFPQAGRLEIEDDVEIGANTTIDRGALEVTRIGRGTKIDNLVQIGHNCQIGEDVVIAAQAGLAGSVVVENNVIMAGQVGIGEHVRIEEGVIIGAQSGVMSKKTVRGKGVVMFGSPARPLQQTLKEMSVLARLARKSEVKD
jgi:UDP-3-O-[3-hydroxymyristoyl] glucosamine N-acyltransferase